MELYRIKKSIKIYQIRKVYYMQVGHHGKVQVYLIFSRGYRGLMKSYIIIGVFMSKKYEINVTLALKSQPLPPKIS